MMAALTLISLEIKSSARKPGDVRGSATLGVLLIIGLSLTPNAPNRQASLESERQRLPLGSTEKSYGRRVETHVTPHDLWV
jgi:hypothetical protein